VGAIEPPLSFSHNFLDATMCRVCSRCKRRKADSAFGQTQGWCRNCHREYYRNWYLKNPKQRSRDVMVRRAKMKSRNFVRFTRYLSKCGCKHCGERDPINLTIPHFGINPLFALQQWKWERIELRLVRCEIVCFNCREARRRVKLSPLWESFVGLSLTQSVSL
jgi:hypothetical protein